MGLPDITNAAAVYTCVIPSTKKAYKYRQFLVKEEKALLIASESNDIATKIDTVKSIIKSCSKTPIDVDSLASFDIEYLFLQLRAKSIGEQIILPFRCDENHGEEDNKKALVNVQINIEDLQVEFPVEHTNKIELTDTIGIVMRYPRFDDLKIIEQANTETDIDLLFSVIIRCIDYIYDEDTIHYAKDYSSEDIRVFIEGLTSKQVKGIQSFFRTLPSIHLDIDYKCPVCGKEFKKHISKFSNFF